KHRSFALRDVVQEAQLLEAQGARELNLVAQDLAHYGRDVRDGTGLPDLLTALIRETSIPWLRLLYLYSAGLTPRLLELMASEARVVPYLDMPIQHASDDVLKRMRRPERRATIRDRVARIRAIIPDVAIRTTCIVGFPGETDADFDSLLDFLEEVQFDRVGVFAYSPQEGTHAFAMTDDVPDAVKRERLERANELQRLVTIERYERRLLRPMSASGQREIARGEAFALPASREIMKRARELFPGGVSSPVRAFGGVGGEPFVVERGEGARIWDVDGNEYIDFVLSWGP